MARNGAAETKGELGPAAALPGKLLRDRPSEPDAGPAGKLERSASAPFFATAPRETPRGRLLLVTHHFPPGQAAGARRWEKLAHFAVRRGFGLDVVTLAPEDLPSRDDRRLASLPEGVRVFGVPRREAAFARFVHAGWTFFRKLRPAKARAGGGAEPVVGGSGSGGASGGAGQGETTEWLRREDVLRMGYGPAVWMSNLRVAVELANEGAWADAAVARAASIFDPKVHRAIVSCGPPHMVHHAARRFSKQTGLPLVVDLRDPWSHNERVLFTLATPLYYDVVGRLEARVFEHASLVVMNTPAARRLMREVHPGQAEKILSITNGFDEDELPVAARDDGFVLAFAGSIYLDRSPRLLFRAVGRVARELGVDASALRVELMGHYDAEAIRAMARDEGVEDRLVLLPPGNVRDVAALLSRSAMLVNLPQDSDLAIPSKIYEYMVYPSWLLALASRESATAQILAETDAFVVEPNDVDRMAEVIRASFLAHRTSGRPAPVARDARLGRAHQASILFDALDRCLAERG